MSQLLIQVDNGDGTWSVLNRGDHGQDPRELALLADRWRVSLVLGDARIRVVDDQAQRRVAAGARQLEARSL